MRNLSRNLSYTLYILLVAFLLVGCDNDNELDGKILTDENGQRYKLKEGLGDIYFIDREVIEIRAKDTLVVWKPK